MKLDYLHLSPGATPPTIEPRPYRAILIAEQTVSQVWRNKVASWFVDNGCLYFIAWGVDCEAWHATVDWTVLEEFDFGEVPDNRFIMTTWHDKEPLSEALWFSGNCAFHPDIELEETIIVHVAPEEQRATTLKLYDDSQAMVDGS